jgi:hypothetical protein
MSAIMPPLCTPELPAAFSALLEHMQSECTRVHQLVALSSPPLQDDDPSLLSFAASLGELEATMQAHEERLAAEEAALADMHAETLPQIRLVNEQLQQQHKEVMACEHLQPKQPATALASARAPLANKTNAPASTKKASSSKSKDKTSSSASAASGGASGGSVPFAPLEKLRTALPPVSEAEFASIPSYMRARHLDRAKLNTALEAWGGALRNKYTLLHTPRAQLGPAQAEQVSLWAGEETSETAGCFVLSAEDLRACGPLQALGPHTLKAVLVALRHIGRVKNATTNSSGGSPKYILL